MTTLPVKTNIFTLLSNLASKPLDDDVQEQLGRVQSLINRIGASELPPYYEESLNIAISALASNKPNLLLAKTILWDLEYYQISELFFRKSIVKANGRLADDHCGHGNGNNWNYLSNRMDIHCQL